MTSVIERSPRVDSRLGMQHPPVALGSKAKAGGGGGGGRRGGREGGKGGGQISDIGVQSKDVKVAAPLKPFFTSLLTIFFIFLFMYIYKYIHIYIYISFPFLLFFLPLNLPPLEVFHIFYVLARIFAARLPPDCRPIEARGSQNTREMSQRVPPAPIHGPV